MDDELKELSLKVYEKTKWNPFNGYNNWYRQDVVAKNREVHSVAIAPKYNSDYLLDKLPESVQDFYTLYVGKDFAMYSDQSETTGHDTKFMEVAETTLKALLKLTLTLKQSGELK